MMTALTSIFAITMILIPAIICWKWNHVFGDAQSLGATA